ncbi:flagellar hook-associated protein FlgK [Shewanella sp.]|uniref:flagellar hook-associated protein FlgK n=1 Tax=Shewanella sp. TaxID=50422 RepID=UPI0040545B44
MAIDLLNIARTGVLASQSQLGVTSSNIANVNTEGYHRQVAQQATTDSQMLGGNYYGTGTYVSDVKRIYNDYAARELRIGQTAKSEAQTTYDKLSELDKLYSQIGKVVPDSLNGLFASMDAVANTPSDLGIRGTALTSADQLAKSLNQMQSHLDGQIKQTNSQITAITNRISDISKEIGNINLELMKSGDKDAQLLDKQDLLIQELSQYAQVNVIPLDTGAKSIMLGGSVMLVSGEVSMKMSTTTGDPFPNEPRLTTTVGTQSLNVDPSSLGGKLASLYNFMENTLVPANQELGQLALGVADTFNQAQRDGFDLTGQVGSNIFTDINDASMSSGRVGEYSTNTGTANLRVNIESVSALTGSHYELNFTAPGTYELKDDKTGQIQALTLNVAEGRLEGGDGFHIYIDSGAFANGDRFEIRPNAGAAAGINKVMTDTKSIAAASAKITPDATNSGNTQVKMLSVTNRGATNFPVTGQEITFAINTTAGTYEAFDAAGTSLGVSPYTAPTITAFGFSFEVKSTAGATDRFTFDLSFAEGDNTNAVAMGKLAETKLMNGNKSTLNDVFEQTKLSVGGKAKSAAISLGSADAVYQQAYDRVQSESGVNLDEEAANLLRFQQSYQASARIMTTAQQIFDTLFNAVR